MGKHEISNPFDFNMQRTGGRHTVRLISMQFSFFHCCHGKMGAHETMLRKHGLTFDAEWNISATFLTKRKVNCSRAKAIRSHWPHHRLSTGGGTSDGRFIVPTGTEVVEIGVSNATAHH